MTNPSAAMPDAQDPYAAAMAPAPPPTLERTFFGQVVIVDPWYCALVSGVGKVLFDPGLHHPDQKTVAVKLSVECQGQKGSYTVDQDVITSSKEWRQFTLPSLQAIGKDLRTLMGCYVQVKRVPTGERYQNRSSGEWKDKTALKFTAVYPDAEAMTAAADAFYTPRSQREAPQPQQPAPAAPAPAPAAAAPSLDRATAAAFLPALWQAAGQDKQKFYELVRTNPLLAAHFPAADAPELRAYLGENWMPY